MRSNAVAPFDVFYIANAISSRRPHAGRIVFEGRWIGARGEPAVIAEGLRFDVEAPGAQRLDVLMVPGLQHAGTADLAPLLAGLAPERQAVREYARSGRLLAASCSGTCLLAEAGLLDGRRCTTSWWLGPHFRRAYPRALLDAEQMVARDGALLTSGSVTSYLDLALWLVGHFGGDELRQLTAKVLAADAGRASQAPYVTSAMGDADPTIERARRWLNRRLDQPWTMAELARHCDASERTLLRRFRDALGLGPLQYAQQLRMERAKALLESSTLSVEQIAPRCGYEDAAAFSKVFKQWVRMTPRVYRQRFGLRR
ncbi:MAG TPA: helix-turn-helix domain-containing protein [Burkholderiaceae bacterium]